jgi:hypothetical protein
MTTPKPLHTRVELIVIRRAYSDTPHRVIRVEPANDTAWTIQRYYPDAVLDTNGGFDSPEGSFIYDRLMTD